MLCKNWFVQLFVIFILMSVHVDVVFSSGADSASRSTLSTRNAGSTNLERHTTFPGSVLTEQVIPAQRIENPFIEGFFNTKIPPKPCKCRDGIFSAPNSRAIRCTFEGIDGKTHTIIPGEIDHPKPKNPCPKVGEQPDCVCNGFGGMESPDPSKPCRLPGGETLSPANTLEGSEPNIPFISSKGQLSFSEPGVAEFADGNACPLPCGGLEAQLEAAENALKAAQQKMGDAQRDLQQRRVGGIPGDITPENLQKARDVLFPGIADMAAKGEALKKQKLNELGDAEAVGKDPEVAAFNQEFAKVLGEHDNLNKEFNAINQLAKDVEKKADDVDALKELLKKCLEEQEKAHGEEAKRQAEIQKQAVAQAAKNRAEEQKKEAERRAEELKKKRAEENKKPKAERKDDQGKPVLPAQVTPKQEFKKAQDQLLQRVFAAMHDLRAFAIDSTGKSPFQRIQELEELRKGGHRELLIQKAEEFANLMVQRRAIQSPELAQRMEEFLHTYDGLRANAKQQVPVVASASPSSASAFIFGTRNPACKAGVCESNQDSLKDRFDSTQHGLAELSARFVGPAGKDNKIYGSSIVITTMKLASLKYPDNFEPYGAVDVSFVRANVQEPVLYWSFPVDLETAVPDFVLYHAKTRDDFNAGNFEEILFDDVSLFLEPRDYPELIEEYLESSKVHFMTQTGEIWRPVTENDIAVYDEGIVPDTVEEIAEQATSGSSLWIVLLVIIGLGAGGYIAWKKGMLKTS